LLIVNIKLCIFCIKIHQVKNTDFFEVFMGPHLQQAFLRGDALLVEVFFKFCYKFSLESHGLMGWFVLLFFSKATEAIYGIL